MRTVIIKDYKLKAIHEIPLPPELSLKTMTYKDVERITLSMDDLCTVINYLTQAGIFNVEVFPRGKK